MEQDVGRLVQAIHDSETRIVLVTAGAGTQALSDLLSVAGATRTLLEALVPYSEASFDEFLGQKPEQYVSQNTARLMAGRALTRARWLNSEETPVVGVACTATIVTDRPKRGEHRAHIATWQPGSLASYILHLDKGQRDRSGEEGLVSRVLLNALAQAIDLDIQLAISLGARDRLTTEVYDYAETTHRLLKGDIDYFSIRDDGQIDAARETRPKVILSGSFNPLHEGHLSLAEAAGSIIGQPVFFELSVYNVDKPPLSMATALERMAQFAGRWPVCASNASTFVEKSRLYPGATFVVGFDTAERILDVHYYGGSQHDVIVALEELQRRNCSFLVAGRVDEDGRFRDPRTLHLPARFASLFRPISADQFRKDVSSTRLREAGLRGSR